jgi:hypothetical protein
VRHSGGTRSRRPWVGAVLGPSVVGGSSTAAMLAAVVGLAMLVLVLVAGAVALGSAFARSADRRRACLHTLQTLLRLAPWTRGDCSATDTKSGITDIESGSSKRQQPHRPNVPAIARHQHPDLPG